MFQGHPEDDDGPRKSTLFVLAQESPNVGEIEVEDLGWVPDDDEPPTPVQQDKKREDKP